MEIQNKKLVFVLNLLFGNFKFNENFYQIIIISYLWYNILYIKTKMEEFMAIKYKNNYGKVSISETVIANIAAASVMESYGVVGLASRSTKDGLYKLLGIENMNRGVKVVRNIDGSVTIDISLFLNYGVRIAVVCQNIIENVKYNVEHSLSVGVASVNILVQGIRS
ncbi:hypothetical protein HMPREF3224_00309 [Anaerococcus hydrogenalis]|nr:hypothetical protein HMPREF3224_00309 [Anaerococcus hydrogenalis]